jgi:parallel beta-helix repeat protein
MHNEELFMKFSTLLAKCGACSFLYIQAVLASTIIIAPSGGTYTSVQTGVSAANAGDTVLVRAGVYNEGISFGKSGSAAAGYITLLGDAGAVLDGTGKGELGISIAGRNYVKVIGIEVQNFKGSGTPIGISVEGSASNLEIRNNKVRNIENANGNAHGIAFYGTVQAPISDILVDGNEIRNCKLGQSESMVLNGNVTNFTVSNNTVHDNDNIGIDFIGFEGNGPSGLDQARSGVCAANRVYNISSAANPTYGGERSADGIYVDGGKDIVIERNVVDNCDIGIEIASEHGGKTTSNIIARNNFVSRSYQGNIMSGGYAANRGNAANIVIVNNTLYQGGDGAIVLQFNNSGVAIKNNICSGSQYLVESGSNNTGIVADNNMYSGGSASSSGAWSDLHAKFGNPLLVNPPADMHLQPTSTAKNAGASLPDSVVGTLDIDGQPRVQENAIDIGADELGTASLAFPSWQHSKSTGIRLTYDPHSRRIFVRGISPDLGSSSTVRVFGLSGKFSGIARLEPAGNVVAIDCSSYSTGMYLFSFEDGIETVLKSFMVY